MPLKDNEGKLGKAFKDAQTPKPEKAPPEPPSKPIAAPALRPDGHTVQQVHTDLENAKRAPVSPQLRDEKAAEFKKKMLVKQEFNRAAKDRVDRDRGR